MLKKSIAITFKIISGLFTSIVFCVWLVVVCGLFIKIIIQSPVLLYRRLGSGRKVKPNIEIINN